MYLWWFHERVAVSYIKMKLEEKEIEEWLHKGNKGRICVDESVIERKRKKQEGEWTRRNDKMTFPFEYKKEIKYSWKWNQLNLNFISSFGLSFSFEHFFVFGANYSKYHLKPKSYILKILISLNNAKSQMISFFHFKNLSRYDQ